jgi:hypothetical protein
MPDYIKVQHEANPTQPGTYVVYVDNDYQLPNADRKLLNWYKGKWCYPLSDQFYRGKVHGWIGPLPQMPLP